MLEMIYTPGGGEFDPTLSTMEYRYNNLTTGSGWVSSGLIDFTNLEGGIPSAFNQYFGGAERSDFAVGRQHTEEPETEQVDLDAGFDIAHGAGLQDLHGGRDGEGIAVIDVDLVAAVGEPCGVTVREASAGEVVLRDFDRPGVQPR